MLTRVNEIRCSRGLRPFCWHPRLFVAAREHSLEQQRCGYMGHESPDPSRRTLVQRMQLAGYDGVMFGEVVAWGYRDTCSVVEGWMNSREHRAILIDSELSQAAFSRVGDYWTGNFGSPRAAPPQSAPRVPRAAQPYRYGSPYVAAPSPTTAHLAPPAVRAPIAQVPPAPYARGTYVPLPVAPVAAPRATRRPTRGG